VKEMKVEDDLKVHSYVISEIKDAIGTLKADIDHIEEKIRLFESRLTIHDNALEEMDKNINRLVESQKNCSTILEQTRVKLYSMQNEIKKLASMPALMKEFFNSPKNCVMAGFFGLILLLDCQPLISVLSALFKVVFK
jgi:chromosome segregation ATPase